MPGPAIAGIIGSVASGIIGSKSASKASAAQERASNAQIAETRRQFDLVQSLLKPYVDAGGAGLAGQLALMGIGGTAGALPTIETINTPGKEVSDPSKPAGPFGGGYGMYGGGSGSNGGGSNGGAGVVQPVQSSRGTTQYKVGDKLFATQAEAQKYAETMRGPGISNEQAQQNEINKITSGAQFGELVKQGEYGILANASATGGLRGGDTQGALAQFRPALLQGLIDRQLANYGGLAANGQNAAGMTGTAAQNAGAQINQSLGDKGAAQAGAALAAGQSWQNAGAGILQTLGGLAQPATPGGGLFQKWVF